MAETRRKAPFNTSVIQKWVNEYADEHGVAAGRLQRWIWFMVVLAVIDRVRDEKVSRHLGHSSLKVTTDIYGHWERAERKIQAAKMEGAFPV